MMSTLGNAGSLSIEQLLRAAKLLEQNAVAMKLAGEEPTSFQLKFGEDYQERDVTSKLRLVEASFSGAGFANSTGSSRRSSPTSMISSSVNSSPNSPESVTFRISTTPFANTVASNQLRIQQQEHSAHAIARSSTSTNSSACSMSTRQSRAAHNELEKNRRANLRSYLDNLKMVLPAEPDSSRDTTLSLLTRARNYMRDLQAQRDALKERRRQLLEENAELKALMESPSNDLSLASIVCTTNVELKPDASESSAFSPASHLRLPTPQILVNPQLSPLLLLNSTNQQPQQPLSMESLMLQGLLPLLPLLYPYNACNGLQLSC